MAKLNPMWKLSPEAMSPASVITLPTLNTSSAGALLPPALGGPRGFTLRAMRPAVGSLDTRGSSTASSASTELNDLDEPHPFTGSKRLGGGGNSTGKIFVERHVEPAKSAEMFVEALRRREEQKQQSDVLPSQPVSTDEADALMQPHQHIVRGGGGSRKHLKALRRARKEAKRREFTASTMASDQKHRPATVNPLSPIPHARLTAAAAVRAAAIRADNVVTSTPSLRTTNTTGTDSEAAEAAAANVYEGWGKPPTPSRAVLLQAEADAVANGQIRAQTAIHSPRVHEVTAWRTGSGAVSGGLGLKSAAAVQAVAAAATASSAVERPIRVIEHPSVIAERERAAMRQRIVDARAAANEKARKQVAKLAEQRAADLAKAREAEEAAAEAETEKETEEGKDLFADAPVSARAATAAAVTRSAKLSYVPRNAFTDTSSSSPYSSSVADKSSPNTASTTAAEGGDEVDVNRPWRQNGLPLSRRSSRTPERTPPPTRTVVTRRAMTPSAPLMRHLGDKKQAFAAATASETDTDATSTISEMTTSQRSEAAKEAAKEAAARLKKGDAPYLTIEVSTERQSPYGNSAGGLINFSTAAIMAGAASPGSPLKEKEDTALGEPSLSVTLDRGSTHGNSLPSTLKPSQGVHACVLTNQSGGPILGTLTVGGASILFALYDPHQKPDASLKDASTSGHSPVNSKLTEALKSLSGSAVSNGLVNIRSAGGGHHNPFASGVFICHPHDGYPAQRLTSVDPSSGISIEAQLVVGRTLKVFVRKATAAETRRAEASEALREAEAGTDYAFLHGRIVAARARGVDQRRLEAAQARLKTLQPDTASKDELVSTLKWDLVTANEANHTGLQTGEKVCSLPGCTVGEPIEGEVLSFVPTAAQQALKGLFADKSKGIDQSVSPDRWLFERISEAAAAAANEGGVWRSGGKFILSAITRNQSPTALHRYLLSIGQKMCAEGIDALVKWTEATYNHHVSAIQINVHIDSTCFHAQHRDIYGLEQRDMAGRDCTCSFKPNIATACLSLGSTRKCLVEAETDDFSMLSKCCDCCEGYSCHHWLRSGSLMYFNDAWNKSHNHGIPVNGGDADADGRGGPRISVALLCAAADDGDALCLLPKAKNIYSTLVDKNKKMFESGSKVE